MAKKGRIRLMSDCISEAMKGEMPAAYATFYAKDFQELDLPKDKKYHAFSKSFCKLLYAQMPLFCRVNFDPKVSVPRRKKQRTQVHADQIMQPEEDSTSAAPADTSPWKLQAEKIEAEELCNAHAQEAREWERVVHAADKQKKQLLFVTRDKQKLAESDLATKDTIITEKTVEIERLQIDVQRARLHHTDVQREALQSQVDTLLELQLDEAKTCHNLELEVAHLKEDFLKQANRLKQDTYD
ncbi:hypothetical protein R1flu_015467 [Riccia fluitans]|uniref:Uncharacterized protein n=1 Tax=Riccia fluitans TaxID=41844 RepID=A0ABD1YJ10_9MARC